MTLTDFVAPLRTLIKSINYPLLNNIKIVTLISSTLIALLAARKTSLVYNHVFAIIALNLVNFVILLFEILDIGSEEEREELSDTLMEVCKYRSPKDKLMDAKSKDEAIRIFNEEDLSTKFLLPNCTYHDLDKFWQKRYYNRWIFDIYTDEFLAMWWETPIEDVEYMRRVMKSCSFKGTIMDSDSEKQTSVESYLKLFYDVLSRVLGVLSLYIISKLNGDKFNSASVSHGIRLGQDLASISKDFTDKITSTITGNDPKAKMLLVIEDHSKRLNAFLETPAHYYSTRLQKLYQVRDHLVEVESFIRTTSKEYSSLIGTLTALHGAACVRKNEIFSSELPNFSRQEPFCVMFRGNGGIGKTHYARYLARQCVNKIFPDAKMSKDYIEVTPADKYWPPLSGQRVALFDEAATVSDFHNDLLMANMKSICSPAYFNCAAADVTHKISPCTFQLVFATTNTSTNDICARIANVSSKESVYSYFRRMIYIEVDYNGTYNTKGGNRYDDDYSHLRLRLYEWDDQEMKPKITAANLTPDALFEKIKIRFQQKANEHQKQINLANMEKQSAAPKAHFSINLNGPGGIGKTPNALEIVNNLKRALAYPAFQLKTTTDVERFPKQEKRCILLCDDLITNSKDTRLELALMDLYNNKLANNSILIFCTNRKYKFSLIPNFTPFGIEFNKEHTFENIGLTRRVGYTGNYTDGPLPAYNREFHFRRGNAYQSVTKFVKYNSTPFMLLLLFLFASLFTYYGLIPSLVLFLFVFSTTYSQSVAYYELPEYIYDSYQDYLNYRKEVKISKDQAPQFEPNFTFHARSATDISVSCNAMQLDKHVYVSRSAFDNADVSWKFFLDKRIAIQLSNNFEKFLCNIDGITRETVVEVIKKYVRTFAELNVDVRMDIKITGLGTFKYIDNTIYLNFDDEADSELLACLTPDGIWLGNRLIPVNMDLFNENLTSMLNLNLVESLALQTLLHSSDFLGNSRVKAMIRAAHKQNLKSNLLAHTKYVKDKLATFYGTPLGKFVTLVIFLCACTPLIQFIVSKFKSQSVAEKRIGTKKIKHNPRYLSDDEKQKGRVGAKKIKVNPRYRSDDERQVVPAAENAREDVMTKCDMNKFQAYRQFLDQVQPKARKNLCQLYYRYDKAQVVEKEPQGLQACYGLFIGGKTLITVGHVIEDMGKDERYSLYVGADEFEGYHRCTPVMRLKMRDISVWRVDSIPIQYPSLTKQFLKRNVMEPNDAFNVAFERLAPGKTTQWLQGEMIYWSAPYSMFADGELVSEFGRCDFATFGIKVTSGGDCGLPYYGIDPGVGLTNVIIGVHFAGNVEGYATSGSCAMVYRDEVEAWLKLSENPPKLQTTECKFCGKDSPYVAPASVASCEGHEIAWSDVHESSQAQFYAEARAYFRFRPNFEGMIVKNSGPIGMGSVEHSHTQFMPNQKLELHPSGGWKNATAEELGISNSKIPVNTNCVYRTVDVKFQALFTCLNSTKNCENFRVYAEVYVDSKLQRRAIIQVIIIDPKVNTLELNQDIEREVLTPLRLPSEVEVYVNEDIKDIFNNATTRYKRNVLPDVPFDQVKDNQTVRVIGTLSENASRVPNPMFKRTPFSDAVKHLIPVEKAPVEYNADRIPEEVRKDMPKDRFGEPNARIGQSIQWAHKFVAPDEKFREYCRNQFVSKFYQYYSNLRLLSDTEIFEGYPYGHRYYGGCSPLELDKSIGFTMKQLYHVQHKSDVISKTPEGKYFWLDNEAAVFAKELFEESKTGVSLGQNHYSAYLELLKMEKLKLAKIYTGRTFCAQDLNGVLIERWVMGNFSAKAIKDDPTCGVGTNAYNDFHNIYLDLTKFNNMFTGDYKRFDRTCPWAVFEDVRLMFIKVNPHLKNEINSVFNSLQKRIQVSGNSVIEVTGGMPSGCTITAPLNCLNNDYMLYCAYVRLANAYGYNTSYLSYNRNVVRKTYGDDVIVSVSDDVSKFYNMTTVSQALLDLFGMTLDSSAKDGTKVEFESYEEASWISRFFRRLDKYPFYVGALKKISIGSHLHYSTSLDPEHLGQLFTTAQWEAALWEKSYFDKIQDAIRIAIKKMPSIAKFFQFRSRHDIQTDLYNSAQLTYIRKQNETKEIRDVSDTNDKVLNVDISPAVSHPKTFFETYRFDRQYKKHIVALCDKVDFDPFAKTVVVENHKFHSSMSFITKLNEAFQSGVITKPFVQFQILNFIWTCEIVFYTKDGERHAFVHYGKSKAEAREGASLLALQTIDYPLAKARIVCELPQ